MFGNKDFLKNFAQKAKRRLVGRDKIAPAKIKVISNDDENFKSKVKNLLEQEEVVTNPIHRLMDDKVLSGLNEQARERYLFSTIDKYNRLKSQIEGVESDSKSC